MATRVNTGIGEASALATSGLTNSVDVENEGFMRARVDSGSAKFRLYWMHLKQRELLWYTTQRPPDKRAQSGDLRCKIKLEYYRVQAPPDDLKKLFAFSLVPTYNAPFDQDDYHCVVAMEEDLNCWKDLLTAACLAGAVPTGSLLSANMPSLPVNSKGERSGFLYVKYRGLDWRAWLLRWCVVQGSPPVLFWSKPPKVGKDTVTTVGEVLMQGAKIRCGMIKTEAAKLFIVQPATGKDVLLAAASRKDAVEWVHTLQYLAEHKVGLEAEQSEAEDAAVVAQEQHSRFQKSLAITKTGHLFFKQSDQGEWALKVVWLRDNQLHWFEPFLPTDDKIQSDDAIMLQDPFAVQGAPKHVESGLCFSLLTPIDRYFFVGLSDAETQAWIKALQLVWHCMRPDQPEGMSTEQLDEQIELFQNPEIDLSVDTVGVVHWNTGAWERVFLTRQGTQLLINEPSQQPHVPGASKIVLPIYQQVSVGQLPGHLGLHGFSVSFPDRTIHQFATHDEAAATLWMAAIQAAVAGSQHTAADFSGPTPGANIASNTFDEGNDLDELDGLDIPSEEEQLADLAALDGLDELDGLGELDDLGILDDVEIEKPTGVLQGLLEKKGDGKVGKWQSRFFVLDTKYLTYFEEKSDESSKKGEFSVKDVRAIRMADGSVTAFNLETSGGTISLRAKTRREAQMWVEAFNDVLSGASGETIV